MNFPALGTRVLGAFERKIPYPGASGVVKYAVSDELSNFPCFITPIATRPVREKWLHHQRFVRPRSRHAYHMIVIHWHKPVMSRCTGADGGVLARNASRLEIRCATTPMPPDHNLPVPNVSLSKNVAPCSFKEL